MLRRDTEDGDAWIKREKALKLRLSSQATPVDVGDFEHLLREYVNQHKRAVDSSINLKQWCLVHSAKLVPDDESLPIG